MTQGEVVGFDDAVGTGTVRNDADGAEIFFHCTQIADGTRTIAVGAKVLYDVVPGHRGLMQAVRITPR